MRLVTIAFSLTFLLSLLNCEQKECCVIPIESQFHGTWELVKITNGFAQIELTGDEIGFKEQLKINASTGTFEQIVDGKRVLFSNFEIGKEGGNQAIILRDDDSYFWYTFIAGKNEENLSLYQKCPIGAILADGSDHEYQKVE